MAKTRVLVVEDDADSNEALRLLLETEGFEADAAFNAQQAVALVAVHVPDLAIIDLGLPTFNGVDLLIALRAMSKLSDCKFVALTGYSAASLPDQARAAGFDRFLLKPVDSKTIIDTVTALLG